MNQCYHDSETHAFIPLFRHSHVTAHVITEQITVMDDLRFQNECLDCMSCFGLFCIYQVVPVIEIGSDKMSHAL